MKIQFHGQSCIQITTSNHSIIIDPFIKHNPVAVTKVEDIKVQYVLLSHGHGDHIADAAEIAKVVLPAVGVAIAEQADAQLIVLEQKAAEIGVERLDAGADRVEIVKFGNVADVVVDEALLQAEKRIAIGT